MKPGYYVKVALPKGGYDLGIYAGKASGNTAFIDQVDDGLSPSFLSQPEIDVLEYATLKDLILSGYDFDPDKIIVEHIAWADSPDAERWQHADCEEDAIAAAKEDGLAQIWICDHPTQPDPRDGVFDATMIVEGMLDAGMDDTSLCYAVNELGWLDGVTRDQETALNKALNAAVCKWLSDNDLWPGGFQVSHQNVKRVKIGK